MASIKTNLELNITDFLANFKKASDTAKNAKAEMEAQFKKSIEGMGIKMNTQELNKAIAEFERLKAAGAKAGKETGEKLGEGIKKETEKKIKGIDFKQVTSTMLGVFGGSVITKGIDGLVGGFKDLIEAGRKSYEMSERLDLAFKSAGLSGNDLKRQLDDTAKFSSQLANDFAVSAGSVREFTAQAALMGGATGQANKDITTLAVGIEKASKGMISGEAVVRAFTRGLGDPEAEANLGRLKMAFPQLATALKGIEKPADLTKAALKTLAPTFATLREQAAGPIGSMQRFQNSLGAIKVTIGRSLVDLFAPLLEGVGTYVVPAVQAVVKGLGSVMKFIGDNKAVLAVAAGAWAAYSAAVWASNGGLLRAYTGMITYAKDILSRFIPAIITKTTTTIAATGAEGAATVATYAWNTALLASPIMWVVAGIGAAVAAIAIFTDWFGKSSEAKLKDAEAEGKLIETQIKNNQTRQDQLSSNISLIKSYEDLAGKANKTAEENQRLSDIQTQLNRTYPGSIKSATDYSANLNTVKETSKQAALELANMQTEMVKLRTEAANNANLRAELKIDVEGDKLNESLDDLLSGVDFFGALDISRQLNEGIKNAGSAEEINKLAQELETQFTNKFATQIKDDPQAAQAIFAQFDKIRQAGVSSLETSAASFRDVFSANFEKGDIINVNALALKLGIPLKNANTEAAKLGATLIDKGKEAGQVYEYLAKSTGLPVEQIKQMVNNQVNLNKQTQDTADATGNIAEAWTNANKIQRESLDKILPEYAALMDKISKGKGTADDERRLGILRQEAGQLKGQIDARDKINKSAKILLGLSDDEIIKTKEQLKETLKVYDLELERIRGKLFSVSIFSKESQELQKQFQELYARRQAIEEKGVEKSNSSAAKTKAAASLEEQIKKNQELISKLLLKDKLSFTEVTRLNALISQTRFLNIELERQNKANQQAIDLTKIKQEINYAPILNPFLQLARSPELQEQVKAWQGIFNNTDVDYLAGVKDTEEKALEIKRQSIAQWQSILQNAQDIIISIFASENKEEVEARKKATKEKLEEYKKERKALQDLVDNNEIDYNEYQRRLSDLDKKQQEEKAAADAEEKKRVEQKNKAIWNSTRELYKNLTSQLVTFSEENGVQWKSIGEIAAQASVVIGTSLAAAFKTGDWSGFLKTMALGIIDFAQSAVNAYSAAAIASSAGLFGLGLPATLAILASANVALGLARAAVSGWKEGGYTGKGDPNKPAGIVHLEEFVVTARAMKANPELKTFLESLNRGRQLSDLAVDYSGRLSNINLRTGNPSMRGESAENSRLDSIDRKMDALIRTTAEAGVKFRSKQSIELEMNPLEMKNSSIVTGLNKFRNKKVGRF